MTKEKPENLKLSSTKDIREKSEKREKGELVKLPSGVVVKLTTPSLFVMVKSGKIPSDMLQASVRIQQGRPEKNDMKDSIKMFEKLAIASFMKPRMVELDPKEDEITPDDLTDEDKLFIFYRTQGEAKGLNRFRNEPRSRPSR